MTADGTAVWQGEFDSAMGTQFALSPEPVFDSGDGHIFALDQASGAERWPYRTGATAEGSVVLADGLLYAGSHDFQL